MKTYNCSRRYISLPININITFGEISGSHDGEYEDDCLLECYAV
jgi:hypothetical protein